MHLKLYTICKYNLNKAIFKIFVGLSISTNLGNDWTVFGGTFTIR